MNIPLSPCVPENLVSRDGFSRPVPRQPAHLHTQAESGAYLRDSSRVPRRRPFMKPPYAIGSVPSLSGHAIAYRWRSLPRVRRHRASKPQGSSERVLPWQVTMDQFIFAPLSHTHYWYEVGMMKVPKSERKARAVRDHQKSKTASKKIKQEELKKTKKITVFYKKRERRAKKHAGKVTPKKQNKKRINIYTQDNRKKEKRTKSLLTCDYGHEKFCKKRKN